MSDYRFLPHEGLPAFLSFLAGQGRLLVPCEQPGAKPSVVFAQWSPTLPLTLAKATVPPKAAVLPPCETLLRYKKVKDPEDLEKVSLTLDDTVHAEPTLVFGARPCDARGFAVLDRPYLEGLYPDPSYAARRKDLTVLTLSCNQGCDTCFCHWVGGGPSSPEGSDVLLTELENGYVLQAVSEKGKALLAASSLAEGEDKVPQMNAVRKEAWKTLSKAPDLKDAPTRIAARFTDTVFWERATEHCLSCGACTYFCPTCYCFNITDEGEAESKEGGRRLRSWDNCMSPLFTREASGHNPRQSKALRMRNRVSHKYVTYPENWGAFSCSGCGRCIQNCPVGLDIRAIVLAAMAEQKTATSAVKE